MSRIALRIFLTIFATLVVTTVSAIGITWWLINERQTQIERELDEQARDAAEALAAGGRSALIDWTRRQRGEEQSLLEFYVIDEWGDELLGRVRPSREPHGLSPQTPIEADSDAANTLDLPSVLLELPGSMPVLVASDGQRFLLLPNPREYRRGPFGLPDTRLPMALIALAFTALGSLWLARTITRPIIDLKTVAAKLADGDLTVRSSQETSRHDDELGQLGVAFDHMAERLSSALLQREQLLRDVSHELRSPLTRIRVAIGLLRKTSAVSSDREIDRIELEIQRLDQLIADILTISRLHGEPQSLRREAVDLRALISSIAADAKFESEQLGRHIDCKLPAEPCSIHADAHWAAAAIENVVRNALRYARDNGQVHIELRTEDSEYRVSISDDGPGVPTDELEKIFEPFHRVERDRARSSGGTGLGLAIAARVLKAHGGRMTACNQRVPQTGLQMLMWWPKA